MKTQNPMEGLIKRTKPLNWKTRLESQKKEKQHFKTADQISQNSDPTKLEDNT